jgi:outer membrane protein TolC
MIAISQKFPFPTKIVTSRRRAQDMTLTTEAEYVALKRRVAAEVKQAYVDLVLIDRTLAICQENLADLHLLEETIRTKYEVGRVSQHDFTTIQIEVLLVEDQIRLLADDDRVQALFGLRRLLGRRDDAPVGEVTMPEIAISEVDTAQVLATGIEDSPEVVAGRHLVRAAGRDVDLARMEWIPDLKLRLFRDERDMAMGRNKARGIVLAVDLPIWAWRNTALADQREAIADQVDYRLEATRDRLESNLRQHVATFSTARRSYLLHVEAIIPRAELAYASARAAYETGATDIEGLVSAQKAIREAKVSAIRLWAKMARGLARIEAITGLDFY